MQNRTGLCMTGTVTIHLRNPLLTVSLVTGSISGGPSSSSGCTSSSFTVVHLLRTGLRTVPVLLQPVSHNCLLLLPGSNDVRRVVGVGAA